MDYLQDLVFAFFFLPLCDLIFTISIWIRSVPAVSHISTTCLKELSHFQNIQKGTRTYADTYSSRIVGRCQLVTIPWFADLQDEAPQNPLSAPMYFHYPPLIAHKPPKFQIASLTLTSRSSVFFSRYSARSSNSLPGAFELVSHHIRDITERED